MVFFFQPFGTYWFYEARRVAHLPIAPTHVLNSLDEWSFDEN